MSGVLEPGDQLIKSGRTAGEVRRIVTIVKISYGSTGMHTIGCFEIGPEPANLSADGEISRSGDSGAAWLFKAGNG